jgi:hypothetical protein
VLIVFLGSICPRERYREPERDRMTDTRKSRSLTVAENLATPPQKRSKKSSLATFFGVAAITRNLNKKSCIATNHTL